MKFFVVLGRQKRAATYSDSRHVTLVNYKAIHEFYFIKYYCVLIAIIIIIITEVLSGVSAILSVATLQIQFTEY